MARQIVTIAVVPRERFSLTKRSLESTLAHRPPGTELVYVDGGSPPLVRQYLEQQAARGRLRLVSTEKFVTPNFARNLALAHVRTKYLALVDNDVLVSPGWLERLVDCAETTGAWVTGPLCCQGEGPATRVHSAGGNAEISESGGRRTLDLRLRHAGQPPAQIGSLFVREPVGQVEFHAALLRTDMLQRQGGFDDQLASAGEHTDVCLLARQHGGEVYLEPGARVTYLPGAPLQAFDLPYFQLRWSETWNRASLDHFAAKWQLPADDPPLQALAVELAEHRRLPLEPYRRLLRLLGQPAARWVEQSLIAPVEEAVNRRRFPHPPDSTPQRWRRAA